MKTLIIPLLYGEIPEHVVRTFNLDQPEVLNYQVIHEGEELPIAEKSNISSVIILYADNPHDMARSQGILEQVHHWFYGIPTLHLAVHVEEPERVTGVNPDGRLIPNLWADILLKNLQKSVMP